MPRQAYHGMMIRNRCKLHSKKSFGQQEALEELFLQSIQKHP